MEFFLGGGSSNKSLIEMLKYTHGFKNWDSLFAVPTFDFHFKVKLPKANKERLILERDFMGRIVHSKPPEMTYPTL